jgi:signal peptide peptidase SppA
VEVGLIDGVCGEAELPARLGKEGGEDEESLDPMPLYLARLPWPPVRWRPLRPRPRLAVVPLSGMIVPGKGGAGAGPQMAGSDVVVKALRAAGRNRRAKAVVLYVASPGGSAVASELILEAVQRVAKKKPVIAFVDRVAASGGYMAALGAREIWSTPHAVVGSIGVFAGKFDASELLERLGVRRTLITRGENAGIFSPSRGFTEHERSTMELEVEETYQAFLEHVARARGRTKEEIHARAEGRIYSGRRALEAGLVDRLGGYEEACRRALELAKVPAERFDIVFYGARDQRFSLLKLLLGGSHAGVYAFCPTAWNLASSFFSRSGVSLLALAFALATGCVHAPCPSQGETTAQARAPASEDGARDALGRFLSAVEAAEWPLAWSLLHGPLRTRYTPERLREDFLREPLASERLRRARLAWQGPVRVAGAEARFPLGDERAVRLLQEEGSWRVVALE